jgi:glutamine synthetase
VFSRDFLANFIEIKQAEYDAIRLRPHPYEFHLYFDI